MLWSAAALATGFPTGFVSAVTPSLWLRGGTAAPVISETKAFLS